MMIKHVPLLLFLICAASTIKAQVRNVPKSTICTNGDTLHFLEYKPSAHDNTGNTRKYPLIIFLHGIGESSNDGTKIWGVQRNGIP